MKKRVSTRTAGIAIAVVLGIVLAVALSLRPADTRTDISLDTIVAAVEEGEATDVVVFESGRIEATIDGEEVASPVPVIALREIVDRFIDSPTTIEVEPAGTNILDRVLPLMPAILIVGLLAFFLLGNKSGGLSSRFAVAERPEVRLDDVIGADEAVTEARHLTDWLADPDAYTGLGAKPATGILLVGPPGVGKTMMAKAVAGETGVPLIAVSGADFVEVFAGLGSRRVKSLFKAASKEAEQHGACVVFIDELDAVGRKRGASLSGLGGQQEAEQTLNALLVALDGFTVRDRVIVLAATNRADVLDDALTRPGRFDRTISLTPPDLAARRDLLALTLSRLPAVDADVDVDSHARRLAGASGADVANLVNTAAVIAAQARATTITDRHLSVAWDRLMMGDARPSAVVHPDDRRVTAIHEGGHAAVGMVLPDEGHDHPPRRWGRRGDHQRRHRPDADDPCGRRRPAGRADGGPGRRAAGPGRGPRHERRGLRHPGRDGPGPAHDHRVGLGAVGDGQPGGPDGRRSGRRPRGGCDRRDARRCHGQGEAGPHRPPRPARRDRRGARVPRDARGTRPRGAAGPDAIDRRVSGVRA
jgi:cell division protease FtsH